MSIQQRQPQPIKGSALIEFAFALALLVPLMAGGWQFYEAYLRVEEIQQAAIRGVEYGSVLPYDSTTEAPAPEFERAIENIMLYRNAEGTGAKVLPGLRRDMINVTMHFESGRPASLTVSVSGFKMPIPGGGLLLQGRPQASYPYRGYWAATP